MMNDSTPVGVLLMAYGSPDSLDDVEAYLTHIRGGRKPSPEAVKELKERYIRIGGRSPLMDLTRHQAQSLQEDLDTSGQRFAVYMGMRHWKPTIDEVVNQIISDGIDHVVALALTPYYSRLSVGAYEEAVNKAIANHTDKLTANFIRAWYTQPNFLEAVAQRLKQAVDTFDSVEQEELMVIFSAHSLPERILQWADPYSDQLIQTSSWVAERAGISHWQFAFQSASYTPEPWLGPDVLEVLEQLSKKDIRSVLICPIGFITDHLEVLYDVDIECKERANELGIHLERTESLNDAPGLIKALASTIKGQLK